MNYEPDLDLHSDSFFIQLGKLGFAISYLPVASRTLDDRQILISYHYYYYYYYLRIDV